MALKFTGILYIFIYFSLFIRFWWQCSQCYVLKHKFSITNFNYGLLVKYYALLRPCFHDESLLFRTWVSLRCEITNPIWLHHLILPNLFDTLWYEVLTQKLFPLFSGQVLDCWHPCDSQGRWSRCTGLRCTTGNLKGTDCLLPKM